MVVGLCRVVAACFPLISWSLSLVNPDAVNMVLRPFDRMLGPLDDIEMTYVAVTARRHDAPLQTLNMSWLSSGGCGGSTWVWWSLRTLMQQHGVQVWFPGHDEMFHEWHEELKAPFCKESDGTEHFWPEDNVEKLNVARKVFQGDIKCSTILSSNGGPFDFNLPTLLFVRGPEDKGAPVEALIRPFDKMVRMNRNSLDRLVCQIADCMETNDNNYKVNNDDERVTEGCFRGRGEGQDAEEYKVHIDPERVTDILDRNDKPALETWAEVTVDYEDLCAFEYSIDADNLRSSLAVWGVLLQGLGVEPNEDIIQEWAKTLQGTRMQRQYSDLIANWDEVREQVSAFERL